MPLIICMPYSIAGPLEPQQFTWLDSTPIAMYTYRVYGDTFSSSVYPMQMVSGASAPLDEIAMGSPFADAGISVGLAYSDTFSSNAYPMQMVSGASAPLDEIAMGSPFANANISVGLTYCDTFSSSAYPMQLIHTASIS